MVSTDVIKLRAETTIDRPAAEIWAEIGDFNSISWIPGVEKWRMEGNLRIVEREAWDFDLVQRLLEQDDERFVISYDLPEPLDFQSMIGPGAIVEVLNGWLSVTPTSETSSTVIWDVEAPEFIARGANAEYQDAIDRMKVKLEG